MEHIKKSDLITQLRIRGIRGECVSIYSPAGDLLYNEGIYFTKRGNYVMSAANALAKIKKGRIISQYFNLDYSF